MKSIHRIATIGAIALTMAASHAIADAPARTDAQQASKQLSEQGRSLADIVRTAEQETGGKAIDVALVCASSLKAAGNPYSSADRARRDVADSSNAPKAGLEYRVACVVDDTQLKNVLVCAKTGTVKKVQNAEGLTGSDRLDLRSARATPSDGALNPDRYADRPGIFQAGPDGHYERIVVWHFVPNDGAHANRNLNRNEYENQDQHATDSGIQTKHDPNLRNHHPAIVQNPNDRASNIDQNRDITADRSNRTDQKQPGEMLLATKLLKANATNAQGQKLGDVEDVAINPDNGEIVYTAVAYGGVLGIGEKVVAVPCDRVTQATEKSVYLDIDESELKENPGFDDSQWPTAPDSALTKAETQHRSAPTSEIKRLSEVIGSELKSSDRQVLGTIDDSVVDTGANQVAFVIVDLADSNKFVAVPCTAIAINHDDCVISMTKEQFKNLPTFDSGQYPAWMDVAWNEQTHTLFNARPYWKVQANPLDDGTGRRAG